jgi:hypothetical protein
LFGLLSDFRIFDGEFEADFDDDAAGFLLPP